MEHQIKGVITAMVTPFDGEGRLDTAAARRLAQHLVAHGSHGVVVAGTTGEAPTLSDDEKIELLEAVLEAIGDSSTVIAGTGSNDTHHTVELTGRAREAGAHAVLVVTPYYNKPSPAGLRAHYAEVSEAARETPVVLYNIPSRSVVNIAPDLLAELAAENANIVAVKQANNSDLGPIEGLDVLAGNDEIFARTLAFGGPGGILVASHVIGPQMREIYEATTAGDHDRAEEIDADLEPVYRAMALTSNPTPVKTALELAGVIDASFRLPIVAATDDERAQIRRVLEAAGVAITANDMAEA